MLIKDNSQQLPVH